jgi:ATP-dependent protease ClpP protease subunit
MRTIISILLVLAIFGFVPLSTEASKTPKSIHLTYSNSLIFAQEINRLNVGVFISAMIGKRVLLDEDQTLYVVVVSGGGDFGSVLAFMEAMDHIPNMKLICKYCASAAGLLFARSAHPRLAIKKSKFLMHEMYMDHVTADMVISGPELIVSLIANSDDFNKRLYSLIGISKEAYENKIRNTEWIVGGPEMIKLHLADELVTIECDPFVQSVAPDTCSN